MSCVESLTQIGKLLELQTEAEKQKGVILKIKLSLGLGSLFYRPFIQSYQYPSQSYRMSPCHCRWELLWSNSTEK